MDSRPLTKKEIVALLTDANLRPSRHRGQNFLIDGNLLRLIADAPALGPGDVVLEVGPGLGQLTRLLAERALRVVAVEVDAGLVRELQRLLADLPNVELIEADILAAHQEVNPGVMAAIGRALAGAPAARFRVVANPPYNVAVPFLLAALTGSLRPHDLHLTLQEEVAERLTSPPGRKAYGTATVLVQSQARVTVLRRVPATAFWPRPRVDSTLVRIEPDAALGQRVADFQALRDLVTGLFQARRKTMHNALGRLVGGEAADRLLAAAGVDPRLRPDAIPVADFVNLLAIRGPTES